MKTLLTGRIAKLALVGSIAGVCLAWMGGDMLPIGADAGDSGIEIADIEADPAGARDISLYWMATTSDGAELQPAFVIQQGNRSPELAEVAGYSNEEQNPMPMIDSGTYYAWTMVVGLKPCRPYRLWVAHLPMDMTDEAMIDMSAYLWDQMTVRSKPVRFWTRSEDGLGCNVNPTRRTTSVQIEDLVWLDKRDGKKRIANMRWQNPGGVEAVVMIKDMDSEDGSEELASLRRAGNPLGPGVTSATIKDLEPCTTYRVRVYERHPNFGSVDQPLRVFRGNPDRKTNSVVVETGGCDR